MPIPKRISVELNNRIYEGLGNIVYVSGLLQWRYLAYGDALHACPRNDWLHRFLMRHKALRQWLRWHDLIHD